MNRPYECFHDFLMITYRASLRLNHLYVMIYAIDSEIKTSISHCEMAQSKQTHNINRGVKCLKSFSGPPLMLTLSDLMTL